MLDTLKYEELAAQVNTKFLVTETTEPIELELVEAIEPVIALQQEFFSLIFLGPKNLLLPQKIYQLAHERLGNGVLFLVPIGQNEEGIRYEAVFNRLINAAD
ncbi:MAG: DUF6916 family protein [Pyrinomonadaceae bacterium]